MKQITLSVPDPEFMPLMELIKKLVFAKVEKIKTEPPLNEKELHFQALAKYLPGSAYQPGWHTA